MKKFYYQFRIAFCLLFLSSGAFAQGPCSGTPATNTVVASSTLVCLGSPLTFSLLNSYNNTGITFQWVFSSVSQVGPFSNISGATASVLSTSTLTGTGWYSVVINCVNSGSIYAVPVYVLIQAPGTTTTVPYYEGFEGINLPNDLPNCSWSATNLGTSSLTFTSGLASSGSKHAAFSYTPAGTNYFYTMGLQLKAGVIYSVAIHYKPNSQTPQNWTDLALLVGTSQSATNSTLITSVNNFTNASFSYQKLDGTFTVSSNGIYYILIRGTSNGNTGSPFMYLDDLSVTVPCTGAGAPNTPTIVLTPSSLTVCAGGGPITVTATGADSYYSSEGNGPVFTFTPNVSSTFTITGTNTLTGCMSLQTWNIMVNPTPTVFPILSKNPICSGETSMLTAFGANTIYLNGQPVTPPVALSPSITTNYTVTGSFSGGCSSNSYTFTLKVNPLPLVSILPLEQPLCAGDNIILTANGASTYQWLNNSSGHTISVTPSVSTNYVVTGTDNLGCSNSATVSLNIMPCTGLDQQSLLSYIELFPNPTTGKLHLKANGVPISGQCSDSQGRILINFKFEETAEKVLDLDDLSPGIYFVRINIDRNYKVYKIVKQ